jgi:ADP-heptose:LPS heptosyltransferase
MLSMDSGNAHIAAMLGKKVVSLWGVTHPYAGFYPFNQDKDWAILADRDKYPKIPSSVYGNKYPDDYKNAIRSISSEVIVDKIKALL